MKWLAFLCLAFPLTLPAQSPRIQEDFSSNKRNWPTDESISIQDGRYRLATSEEGGEPLVSFFMDQSRDFSISVDIDVKQAEGDAAIGLAWAVGSTDYNVFMISPVGEYVVASGDLSKLKGWKKSSAIRPAPAANQLKIENKAGTYSFLVNGQMLEQRKGIQFFGSYSGILVFSSLEAFADNFSFDQVQEMNVAEEAEKFTRKENLGEGVNSQGDGYYAMHDNLELQALGRYQEISRDLYLVPIVVGRTIKLNNVFFEAGTPVLKPESYPELDHLVELLNDNPGITIDLAGHTDNKGDIATLIKLSEDRVGTVRNYLITKGIDSQRITGKGYGAQFPVAPSDTEENSRLNRRVEFKITKM
ncbi:MAG: OmpA family protein [Cyclobacteriaceae bacterium]